jgi:KipI family sensor histidine kinase inhibitor
MRVLPCGDGAVLVELDGLPEVWAFAAAARGAALPGVVDVVPAAPTVLVVAAPGTDLDRLRGALLDLPVDATAVPEQEPVEIPVVYDGPDLDEVGRLTGLGADGVVSAHTATPWRVGFGGFAPGFAYLTGGDERLRVARRDEPRTAVPAGSVGLAGEFSGSTRARRPGMAAHRTHRCQAVGRGTRPTCAAPAGVRR